nr:hypothetical protein CFP56_11420 [Quercus suber]
MSSGCSTNSCSLCFDPSGLDNFTRRVRVSRSCTSSHVSVSLGSSCIPKEHLDEGVFRREEAGRVSAIRVDHIGSLCGCLSDDPEKWHGRDCVNSQLPIPLALTITSSDQAAATEALVAQALNS